MSELPERRALNPLSLASLRALAFNTRPPPSSSKRYGFVTRKGLPDSMLALLLHGLLVGANAVESGRWRHVPDDYDAMGAHASGQGGPAEAACRCSQRWSPLTAAREVS